MSNAELTPTGGSRYDGYMSAGTSTATAERPSSYQSDVAPAPVSEATASLKANADTGRETGVEPISAKTDALPELTERVNKEGRRNLTSNELIKVANTVQGKASAGDVMADADFVSNAAKILIYNIESDVANHNTNQVMLAEFKANKIPEAAKELAEAITVIKANGQLTENEDTGDRWERIKQQAGRIADLAKTISSYYERAKLSREYDDPFRQVVSFEELMTRFNITLDDDRFKSGGDFSLIDINEYEDQFGRQMSDETAHPENFYRWVMERAEFYHDFDPMAPVDLFQGMYIVAGSRKIPMYEMLVDFNSYFAHRVKTKGELKVLESDLDRAEKAGTYESMAVIEGGREVLKTDPYDQKALGRYKNVEIIDEETGEKKTVDVYVSPVPEEDQERHVRVLPVYYYNDKGKLMPVREWLQSKEQWDTIPPKDPRAKEFENAQEEIMYQLWLQTKSHNADVNYRQKGMPSETPLKDVMAEIYSDNIWTRTHRRIAGILDMPASTYRGDVDENGKPINEAAMKWKGKDIGQGTLGKAFQRSLAAYYHIAEANAEYNKYNTEGFNPFFNILERRANEGKGELEVNGGEIFYKALIGRLLTNKDDTQFDEGNLSYRFDKKHPESSFVEAEFLAEINNIRVPIKDGTTRARFAWEKAELADLLMHNRADFLTTSNEGRSRSITSGALAEVERIIRERYAEKRDENGNVIQVANRERLQQLQIFLDSFNKSNNSDQRRGDFLDMVKKRVRPGSSESDVDAYNRTEKAFRDDASLKNLSGFAVAMFVRSFDGNKDFTAGINPYENIRYSLDARELMRGAMRDTISYTEKLDDHDALWAEEWAYTFTFHTGISARNDMQGIGHDAWSKVINTEFYRLRQSGGGNYLGNKDNLYGIHRLGTDFWQGLKVREKGSNEYGKNLYEILVGLENVTDSKGNVIGHRMNLNKDVKKFEFAGNAMRQFYADHVSHAVDMFIDITQKQEFNLDKLLHRDQLGRMTWNNEEMQKMIDSTWKHMRYGFDNNGFLYDNTVYGWLYDETINAHGQVSRKPHFGFMTLRESMFSKKVREMGMYNRHDVSGWAANQYKSKMGRNVFAYLIAAQLREHTRMAGGYKLYSAEDVEHIAHAFMEYAARVMQGQDGEAIVLSGFFTPEEMMKILVTGHAILWALWMREYRDAFTGGFLFGFFEALGLVMKQAGAGIKF